MSDPGSISFLPSHPTPGSPGTGLRRDSILRLMVTVMAAALGLASGIVVARRLGPTGKGTVSMLDFTSSVAGATASLGLAEASITMVRRRGADLATALWTSLATVVPASVLGMLGVLVATQVAYGGNWSTQRQAILVATAIVPLNAVARVLAGAVDARQRVDRSSLARGVEPVVIFTLTVLAIGVLRTGASGALVAIAVGEVAAIIILAASLVAWGPMRRPHRPSLRFVRDAMRIAVPVQAAAIVIALAGRIDLLPVQAIAGSTAAGFYSVALTLAQVVTFPALALSIAAYPRLSGAVGEDWLALTEHVVRKAIATAVMAAIVAIAAAPIVVPMVFGRGFEGAVTPAMILSVAAVLSAAQIVLGRARAAAGHPGALLVGFSTSLVVMLVGDSVLISPFGIVGAAVASFTSSLVGLGVILGAYRRAFGAGFRPTSILPRTSDFTELVTLLLRRS